MSWSDFHERRAVLEGMLSLAQHNVDAALQIDEIPGAAELFGCADNLLLALQHRWSNHLAAKLDQALENGTPLEEEWFHLAAEQPALRALLDAGAAVSPPLRVAQRGEQRMIDAHSTGRLTGRAITRRRVPAPC
ncbi:hypothetical protein [Rhodococcus tibetensis]|uniref:Uncharacterized protein n=1 Tax=Rhodococcus tibetensis TaxID=2965064 RepID=A0ABT1QL21_9NOCA|nr:hypothetical protein [Rhodococcus sp. FXJ9.536]MCQ4121797.1 hypothetical protein [Rhodococcus sp. FXJ9.536]